MTFVCRIELLGGLRAQIKERSLTRFRTQKIASLLAYLAYHRHQQHPREVLVEMIWPDCDPTAGRARLSNALWSLRQQLEPPGTPSGSVLQTTYFSIGLNPAAITTDVAEFLTSFRKAARATEPAERLRLLRHAAQLYQDELLPGFYEDWVLTEQRRLADLYEQVQHLLHTADLKTGTLEAVTSSLREPAVSSAPDSSASLPVSFTRFFGREEELTRLQELLSPLSVLSPKPRLVTITGAGGTGKTRLSQEIARRLVEAYFGLARFIPLSNLRDASLIGSSLVEALSLPRSGQIEPLEQVVTFLKGQGKPALLVLDNFEQLVEGGAEVVQTLLERVPTLTLLITSRRLLNLSFEREFVLRPLPTPEGTEPLERLHLNESVRLFTDRAQNVRPDFQIAHKNAPAVTALCQKLEGVPLAIELAAARAQVLPPAQMLSLMERRFDFLVSRKRDVSERHQSLWSALDWSYRLLSPELQRFFAKLSVFRGGWTWEPAETVCEEPQALEYLEQLREWSLVSAEETEAGMRFHMLETLREFAEGQLTSEETTSLQGRHALFFIEAVADKIAPPTSAWMEAELENLRAILDRSQTHQDGREWEPRLAEMLHTFWLTSGRMTEGRTRILTALQRPEVQQRTGVQSALLKAAALLALFQNDFLAALDLYTQSWNLGLARSERDLTALGGMGMASEGLGDLKAARDYEIECLEAARASGNLWGIAGSLNILGLIEIGAGDQEAAMACFQECHAGYTTLGQKRGIGIAIGNMGWVHLKRGDYDAARQCLQESLQLFFEVQDKMFCPDSLFGLGGVAAEQEQWERAAHLLGVAEALNASFGIRLRSADQADFDRWTAFVRSGLGEKAFAAVWQIGRAMKLEEAVAYALEET